MPYIVKGKRKKLDKAIDNLVSKLYTEKNIKQVAGDINYCISRICGGLIDGKISYFKIAVLTGVLENAKQELYRRVAAKYEDQKINANGDLREYK